MRPWFQLPVKDRMELLREYKKLGYSYSNAVKDFEDSLPKYEGGGTLPSQQPFVTSQSTTQVANRNFELEAEARKIQAAREEDERMRRNFGEIKPASFRQKINMLVPDRLRTAQENLVKVKDNLIIPTANVAMALSGKTIPKYIGSAYLGNKMAEAETSYPEAAVAVTGMLGSRTAQLTGGVNDLKQSYEDFKKGDYSSGLLNAATGLGGVWHDSWIPGKYDDIIAKTLRVVNAGGDAKDVQGGVEEALIKEKKEFGGVIPIEPLKRRRRK